MSKSLPKSLHTVTVLVNVARLLQFSATERVSDQEAIASALVFLGYANCNDMYNLAGAALKAMGK